MRKDDGRPGKTEKDEARFGVCAGANDCDSPMVRLRDPLLNEVRKGDDADDDDDEEDHDPASSSKIALAIRASSLPRRAARFWQVWVERK